MEFLVEFDVNVPNGASPAEIENRQNGEAVAAAKLVREGHLVRLWKPPAAAGESKALGVYRADSRAQLDRLLADLPLSDWMKITVTPLEAHPNDPDGAISDGSQLPDPRLTPVFRLDATLGQPLDLGDTDHGHRRIAPLTGGTFTGPELNGKLLPGASADWQTVMPDGTTIGDIRYTLRTGGGDILYVQSRGVRHGRAEVLARLARGEEVNAGEYTFRTATQIETAAPSLDWLNKGVFVAVGGRQAGGVTYATYLVG
jgi:muconolactone delta-isomerase